MTLCRYRSCRAFVCSRKWQLGLHTGWSLDWIDNQCRDYKVVHFLDAGAKKQVQGNFEKKNPVWFETFILCPVLFFFITPDCTKLQGFKKWIYIYERGWQKPKVTSETAMKLGLLRILFWLKHAGRRISWHPHPLSVVKHFTKADAQVIGSFYCSQLTKWTMTPSKQLSHF